MTSPETCPAPRHDSFYAYNDFRCRCPEAREAAAEHNRTYRKARYLARGPLLIDATGTRRRVNALRALGWPLGTIAVKAGLGGRSSFSSLMHTQDMVRRTTAARIAAVYAELSMTPGGDARTRTYAQRMGWPPPLAWDEDTIDDPTALPYGMPEPSTGKHCRAGQPTVWDDLRWEDVERLRSYGVGDEQIAERFGTTLLAFEKAERRRVVAA